MTHQPTATAARVATKVTLSQLRHRMIQETEAFLNERLYRRNGDWATDERVGGMLKPLDTRHDRRQMPPRVDRCIDVRTSPDWGTLIEIRPNELGIVDDARLQALEVQLRELTGDPTAGDIVIGLQRVAVMTAGFMSLLAAIRPRLVCQNRKLSLHGLRPQCALLLRDTGLEVLIEHAKPQAAVVAAPLLKFDDALTARSRGSGRAA